MTSWCRGTRRRPRWRAIVPTISNRKQRTTHMNESVVPVKDGIVVQRHYCNQGQCTLLHSTFQQAPARVSLPLRCPLPLASARWCVLSDPKEGLRVLPQFQGREGLPPTVALGPIELDSKDNKRFEHEDIAGDGQVAGC